MTQIYPSRLSEFDATQKNNWLSRTLNKVCKQPVQPSKMEYSQLQNSLLRGDQVMDKVIEWIMQDPKQRRQLFETALFQGIDQLDQSYPILEKFFQTIEAVPSWVDQSKINHAINFTHRLGHNNSAILRDVSLMAGYMFPGFNQPLLLTGALKQQAAKRLIETTKWWIDVTTHKGLQRFNSGFTSTIYVRFIHGLVRKQLSQSDRWDQDVWGVPINQFDLAMTNIAFSNVVLLAIRGLGIFPNKIDVDSYLHFWRYVGWLMGIEQQWLIDKESDGWRWMYWLQFSHPAPDNSSSQLAISLSKEPYERLYPKPRSFYRKVAYRQHLQLTQFFIGKKRMKSLGLPTFYSAWFAYYLILRNLAVYSSAKRVKWLNSYLESHGRKKQKMALRLHKNPAKKLASMH